MSSRKLYQEQLLSDQQIILSYNTYKPFQTHCEQRLNNYNNRSFK